MVYILIIYNCFFFFLRAHNMYPLRKPTVAMSDLVTIYFPIFGIDYLIYICEYFMYLTPNMKSWLI